eukprot:TRINITY_DN1092_c0_g2_i1.p1 TRINITY_DN1092_c0_g2~~TRINITY_DN1092_c0_g2_i1.p1  ORF type:complete len:330 (+),score=104.93 TRINITY_DN1092_c0_g2_i1:3-992(+)
MKGNEDDMMMEDAGSNSGATVGSQETESSTQSTNGIGNDIDYDEMPPLSPNIVDEEEEEGGITQEKMSQQQQSRQQEQQGGYRVQGDVSFQHRVSSIFDVLVQQQQQEQPPPQPLQTWFHPHQQHNYSSSPSASVDASTGKWTHYSLEDVSMDGVMGDGERENRMALAETLRMVSEANDRKMQEQEDKENDAEGDGDGRGLPSASFRPTYQKRTPSAHHHTSNSNGIQHHCSINKPNAKRKMNVMHLEDDEEDRDEDTGMDVENENTTTTTTTTTASTAIIPKHLMMDGGGEDDMQQQQQQQQQHSGYKSPQSERKPAARRYRTRGSDD